MGREDERNRIAAVYDRRTWRQGNRPERDALHHPRRRLCEGLCEAQSQGLSASLAIGPGRKRGEGEESQQDEIHLPGLWTERLGKAGRSVNLRHLLRRRRGRYLRDAGRAGRRGGGRVKGFPANEGQCGANSVASCPRLKTGEEPHARAAPQKLLLRSVAKLRLEIPAAIENALDEHRIRRDDKRPVERHAGKPHQRKHGKFLLSAVLLWCGFPCFTKGRT